MSFSYFCDELDFMVYIFVLFLCIIIGYKIKYILSKNNLFCLFEEKEFNSFLTNSKSFFTNLVGGYVGTDLGIDGSNPLKALLCYVSMGCCGTWARLLS